MTFTRFSAAARPVVRVGVCLMLVVDVVLLVLRLNIVNRVTGNYLGSGCKHGQYDPTEHTYLLAMIAVTVVVLVLCHLGFTVEHRTAWLIAFALIAAAAWVLAVYLLLVGGGGLELNNKPIPEDECAFPHEF